MIYFPLFDSWKHHLDKNIIIFDFLLPPIDMLNSIIIGRFWKSSGLLFAKAVSCLDKTRDLMQLTLTPSKPLLFFPTCRWCSTPVRGPRSWGSTASWRTRRCPSLRCESTPCPASPSTTRDPKQRCQVRTHQFTASVSPSVFVPPPFFQYVLYICLSRSLPRHRQLLWGGGRELLVRTGRQRRPRPWTGVFG